MALDDLLASAKVFQDGMQQLAVGNGIREASDQVQQINQSSMDEMQKRQARMQAANQLAMQLVAKGANAQQVGMATQAVSGPQASSPQELFQQGLATGDQSLMKAAKQAQSFQEQPEMDKLGMQGQNAKDVANIHGKWQVQAALAHLGQAQKKDQMTAQNRFNSYTKDINTQLDALDAMPAMLDEKNPISDQALKMALPRVLGDLKGRIPVQEIQMFGGDPSLWNKVNQGLQKGFNGLSFTDKDRAEIASALAKAKNAKQEALKQSINQFVGQTVGAGVFNTEDQAKQLLVGNHARMMKLAGMDQPQAAAPAAGSPAAPASQGTPQSLQAGMQVQVMRNKLTGLPEKVMVGPDGKYYPYTGN